MERFSLVILMTRLRKGFEIDGHEESDDPVKRNERRERGGEGGREGGRERVDSIHIQLTKHATNNQV